MRVVNEASGGARLRVTHLLFEDFLEAIVRVALAKALPTDAEIEVPAGRYSDCVLAVGRASFHLDAETGFAASDVPIEQREWYCPGVGLTRLSRDERLTSGDRTITGGRIEIVLTRAPG